MWKRNKLLRWLLLPFMMGIDDLDAGGGGAASDFNMDSALDSISEGLGFDTVGTDDDTDTSGEPAGDDADADESAVAGDPPADESAAPAGDKPEGEAPPADPAAAAAAGLEPPKTWRPEAAAKWATVDPEVRAEILKREADMFKGLETYKADATTGKAFQQVVEPFKQLLARDNLDPVQMTQQLMSAHVALTLGTPEQKTEYIQWIAKTYGVPLQAVPDAEAPYVDPEVKALRDELNSVKSNLNAEAQRRTNEIRQQMAAKIEAFATNPAHPYFDEVSADITKLLKTGMELEEAYEKAVWANPVTRAKELDRVTAEKAAKAQAEAKAKAEAARKATAANVKTKAKQASGTAPLGSLDETLKEAFRAISSRGE